MKKNILFVVLTSMLMSSCFVFKKKEKYGCPNDARNMSQEEIVQKAGKRKYKGGSKM